MTTHNTSPTNAPQVNSAPRYDTVEGLAPSAPLARASNALLILGLVALSAAILIASATLCVAFGFGIELAFGSVIALVGIAPVVIASLARHPESRTAPVPVD